MLNYFQLLYDYFLLIKIISSYIIYDYLWLFSITFNYFWLFHPMLLLVILILFHLRLFSTIVSFFGYFMLFLAIVNYFNLDNL
jgi:hypothetical protein